MGGGGGDNQEETSASRPDTTASDPDTSATGPDPADSRMQLQGHFAASAASENVRILVLASGDLHIYKRPENFSDLVFFFSVCKYLEQAVFGCTCSRFSVVAFLLGKRCRQAARYSK